MNNNEITDPKQEVNDNHGKKTNAQDINESGVDYIWGSDQDEYARKPEKE
ncbi:hypothetical protein PaecuDRAFT_0998 [Paenibacillus curdlanolyticus YK9]|uniref:Uncharacterized protein n=1 Tax=Paenibacillus curdlanolyticus YK9 TaxID=717606 RepID=E0I5S6_9BACL|nr:hypothetical protein [Paenibacillus curdlanolyticus]EFM12318.1 hypothetical protein PaecuDRAFT_0998 [Paenibacillus curdlanolyticus YK9]